MRALPNEPPLSRRVVTGSLTGGRYAPGYVNEFNHAVVSGVDFSRVKFETFTTRESTFIDCDFSRARFEAGAFGLTRQSVFRGCRFDGADLRHIALDNVRFESCTFDGAKIHDWRSDRAEFVGCHFAGRITSSMFAGRPWGHYADVRYVDPLRSVNEFRDNDFRHAELIDCAFYYGIDIGAQLWPAGPEYIRLDRFPERVARVRAVLARWPHDADRERGLGFLQTLAEVYTGQEEVFLRKDNLERWTDKELLEQVWRMLATAVE